MNNQTVIIFGYFVNPKYNFIQNIVDWYSSMKENYLADCNRKFIVYTDNKSARNLMQDEDIQFVDVDSQNTTDIGKNKLNKFKYIEDCVKNQEFDYFSFIQSNARCIKPVGIQELVGEKGCDLTAFRHCRFPKLSFNSLYYNKLGSTVDISKINTSQFVYVQNCHFLANKKTILRICEFINQSVDKDYVNPMYSTWYNGKTPSIYDERYFNYYLNTSLLKDDSLNVKILNGHVYIHAPYSNSKDFKIDMIDKTQKYKPTSRVQRKVSILMASFPYRKKWMLQCIERLIPQCDNFYLWLNEYKEIPDELKKYDESKLHITIGDKNLKENGRYTFLNKPELQEDYCFICDDDINWPKDYVKRAVECFQRNGDNILIAYFINNEMNRFQQNDVVKTGRSTFCGVEHNRFGAGTCGFVPSIVNFKFSYDELVAHYDMELFFAQQCINQGIKMYLPKRPANWISFIQDGHQQRDIEKYALSRSNSATRIRNTIGYMRQQGMFGSKGNDYKKSIVEDNRRFWYG